MIIRYLIGRPIAVLSFFLSMLIAGFILFWKIPISLLPNLDVPAIIVHVNGLNTSAVEIEKQVIKPIRERLSNLDGLEHIESEASNHTGVIRLFYKYSTKMDLASIQVNEEVDRLMATLPRDLERPVVSRVATSNIPIVRLQVIPKNESDNLQIGDLAQAVLKRRIEQVEGISLVDINGRVQRAISIIPQQEKLRALQIDDNEIIEAIKSANNEVGGLNVIDGQYKYFINLTSNIHNVYDISDLPLRTKRGDIVALKSVATIGETPIEQTGFHLFNGHSGIVMAIQMQPDGRMNTVLPEISLLVKHFKKEYPDVKFALSQDQSFLLDAGISNLYQDLAFGGILTIALLFLFLGNWKSSLLMALSIPISLILTCIFFYLFDISFNIISLSGLTLGIGMLIDNSIVVIDNINRKRISGRNVTESCVEGTVEVVVPVVSQVLTTVAVYTPLILLSSLAGALVNDQSIALSISLFVSLIVAFILCPLLYNLIFKTGKDYTEDTAVYKWISMKYHLMIENILKRRRVYFFATLALMPIGPVIAFCLPVTSLPEIEKSEGVAHIFWNDPITSEENLYRVKSLTGFIQQGCIETESDIGVKQFSLQDKVQTSQEAELYFKAGSSAQMKSVDSRIKKWIASNYPNTYCAVADAPNAFTQLFDPSTPYFEAKFKFVTQSTYESMEKDLAAMLREVPSKYSFSIGKSARLQRKINFNINDEKAALYAIDKSTLVNSLKQQFGQFNIAELKRFGSITTILYQGDRTGISNKLNSPVKSRSGATYPIREFVTWQFDEDQRTIMADKTGNYSSVEFFANSEDIVDIIKLLNRLSKEHDLSARYSGQYFENKNQIRKLWMILLVVMILLYFILVIQYENIVLPLIVMLTIPLGVTGGMFFLWISHGTLNVMSGIGFIIILGLIVDDPILKIETLKRLEQSYEAAGTIMNEAVRHKMIHEAGEVCLKPLLLVSLTTSIAMVPVLFFGGIGNDLQKPLAVVIIGGLTIGTFFTTWFIPLAYWYVAKMQKNILSNKPLP